MSVLNFVVSGWRMLNGSYEAGGKRTPDAPPTPADEAENIAENNANIAAQKAQEDPEK